MSTPLNSNHCIAFQDSMASYGIKSLELPIDDGKLHRFRVEADKANALNGWYVLHGGELPAGAFGCWKRSIQSIWSAKSKASMNSQELAQFDQQQKANKAKIATEQKLKHEEAAKACASHWDKANPNVIANHPYIAKKQIKAYGIKQLNKQLLIPLRNSEGQLVSIQYIQEDGTKRFKSGGQKKGCYCSIGKVTDVLYICEGYATGATIHEASNQAVAIAFDEGNLLLVAQSLQKKLLGIQIIIAADNDINGEQSNVGIESAIKVSNSLNIAYTYPEFSGHKIDFNDLKQLASLDEVKEQLIKNIVLPSKEAEQPPIVISDDDKIELLAQLSTMEYERQREAAAKTLGCRASVLDKQVASMRKTIQESHEEKNELKDGIEPYLKPVNSNELLNEVKGIFNHYCILPTGADTALSLWAVSTYCINAFRIYPKLCLSSPEKRCGKTTTLEVLASIVNRRLMASNVSPSVIFRCIEAWAPSLLIDEADTFIHGNEELRGIINCGHTKSSASVLRTESLGNGEFEPRQFSTWSPMCIAMIKKPPSTIIDRSVLITLRRKLPDENVRRLPVDVFIENTVIRQKCQRWVNDNFDALKAHIPDRPKINNDRAEDNWWPLLTVADIAGGIWPEIARKAMVDIERREDDDDSGAGSMILSDIREIYESKKLIKLFSQELVDYLIELEDRPWCEWKHGKPLTKNTLANLLKPFGIKSKQIRIGGGNQRGYEKTVFEDSFVRYLQLTPIQSVTSLQTNNHVAYKEKKECYINNSVTFQKPLQARNDGGCNDVTLQEGGSRERTPISEENSKISREVAEL